MIVLAIDPGTTESAWVTWDGTRILEHAKEPNAAVRKRVAQAPFPTIGHLAVEMIASYGMPVGAEVFETCLWIGRFIEIFANDAAERYSSKVYRRDVKLHLCGSARAKDANIRQALIDRFGKPGTKKAPGLTFGLAGDEWSAFAVAVTWYDQQQQAERVA